MFDETDNKGRDGLRMDSHRTGPPYKLGEAASFEDARETWPPLNRSSLRERRISDDLVPN